MRGLPLRAGQLERWRAPPQCGNFVRHKGPRGYAGTALSLQGTL